MTRILFSVGITMCLFTSSCNNSSNASRTNPGTPVAAEHIATTSTNKLSMKINGKDWIADHEVWGAFHPKGYNNAILTSGSVGSKDKNEQAFNLNIYNAAGPGTYVFANGNTDQSVIQMANLSTENYLYGSMLGFDVKVNILKASDNPVEIEATFEGELTGNASDKLTITDGKFYYKE